MNNKTIKVKRFFRYKLKLDAIIENWKKLSHFLLYHLDKTPCSERNRNMIVTSSEELFSNVVQYAYKEEIGYIEIIFDIAQDNSFIKLTFIDEGIPYNPLAKADPNLSLSCEDRQIGGLGIYMVKKLMDDIQYCYQGNKNQVTITKYI